MRILSLAVGVIALLVGAVWTGQGAGWIAGSFMTGSRFWLIIGIVVALVGLVLVVNGLRRPARQQ